jgi:hypothetical protein
MEEILPYLDYNENQIHQVDKIKLSINKQSNNSNQIKINKIIIFI